jgi:hypothetical protein
MTIVSCFLGEAMGYSPKSFHSSQSLNINPNEIEKKDLTFFLIRCGNASWRREEKKVFIALFYVLMLDIC